jgi:hypothetical protein
VNVQYVLSLISIFRTFQTRPKISFSSIEKPFTGVSQSLDLNILDKVLKSSVDIESLHLRPYRFIKLETASPTGWKSFWNSSSDIIALVHNPANFWSLVRFWNFAYVTNWLIFIWLMFLVLISLPFALLTYLISGKQYLGKISVVYDSAGKARLVGITNYWVQLVLRPLHDSIFMLLSRFEEDGTFEQHKPLALLVTNEHSYHSFDLSAATDRLPIALQSDILNYFGNNLGNRWKALLNWEFYYSPFKTIRYSVGQPMGAYSSWAMLALTHHIIVRFAMHRAGISQSNIYAILGDDIVIKHDQVALEYLKLMDILGVSINLSKSVISKDFAEFAKVWRGPHVEYTPLGAGLILRLLRDNYYLGNVLNEMMKLKIIEHYGACLKILNSLPKALLSARGLGLWSIFGLKGTMWKLSGRDVSYLKRSIAFILTSAASETIMTKYLVFNAVRQAKIDMLLENHTKLLSEMRKFIFKLDTLTSNNWSLRLFEAVSRFISPGFWVYLYSFLKDYKAVILKLLHLSNPENWNGTLEEAAEMVEESMSITSIDWSNKKEVKLSGSFYKRVFKNIKRLKALNEVPHFSLDSLVLERTIDIYEIDYGIKKQRPLIFTQTCNVQRLDTVSFKNLQYFNPNLVVTRYWWFTKVFRVTLWYSIGRNTWTPNLFGFLVSVFVYLIDSLRFVFSYMFPNNLWFGPLSCDISNLMVIKRRNARNAKKDNYKKVKTSKKKERTRARV